MKLFHKILATILCSLAGIICLSVYKILLPNAISESDQNWMFVEFCGAFILVQIVTARYLIWALKRANANG